MIKNNLPNTILIKLKKNNIKFYLIKKGQIIERLDMLCHVHCRENC